MAKEVIKMFTNIAITFNIASAILAFITRESQPWWLYAIDNLILAYLFYANVHRS